MLVALSWALLVLLVPASASWATTGPLPSAGGLLRLDHCAPLDLVCEAAHANEPTDEPSPTATVTVTETAAPTYQCEEQEEPCQVLLAPEQFDRLDTAATVSVAALCVIVTCVLAGLLWSWGRGR